MSMCEQCEKHAKDMIQLALGAFGAENYSFVAGIILTHGEMRDEIFREIDRFYPGWDKEDDGWEEHQSL